MIAQKYEDQSVLLESWLSTLLKEERSLDYELDRLEEDQIQMEAEIN